MSRNDSGDRLCPGCGKPIPPSRRPACSCTVADVVDIFERDRAELSRRAAGLTARSNDAIRLLRAMRPFLDGHADDYETGERRTLGAEIDAWIENAQVRS